jgi:opacity protein-like surface antigen
MRFPQKPFMPRAVDGDRLLSPFVPPSPPCVAPGSVWPCPLATWSGGTTKTGWTIGAGIEWLVAGNWSLKAEYLYVDLGTVNS